MINKLKNWFKREKFLLISLAIILLLVFSLCVYNFFPRIHKSQVREDTYYLSFGILERRSYKDNPISLWVITKNNNGNIHVIEAKCKVDYIGLKKDDITRDKIIEISKDYKTWILAYEGNDAMEKIESEGVWNFRYGYYLATLTYNLEGVETGEWLIIKSNFVKVPINQEP